MNEKGEISKNIEKVVKVNLFLKGILIRVIKQNVSN